jgi:hypothetical protein
MSEPHDSDVLDTHQAREKFSPAPIGRCVGGALVAVQRPDTRSCPSSTCRPRYFDARCAGGTDVAEAAKQSRERSRGVVESCATQSGAKFPGAFTSPRNLVVGPLSLVGAGGMPDLVWDSTGKEGFQKFHLLVRENYRVVVELSQRTRRGAGLAYGPLPHGEVHLRDTHRVVTFIACRSGQSSSSADGEPVTFWSGAVLARSPRCVPLLVWVDDQPSRRAVIRLGVRKCG